MKCIMLACVKQSSFTVAAVMFAMLMLPDISGLQLSCNFRCSCKFRCFQMPTLLDHFNPTGCYCHDGCGGHKFRCCRDKDMYCGSRGSGGEQACLVPKKVSNAKVVGQKKLFYRRRENITYECDFHYVLQGSSTRSCFGHNIWTPAAPRCKYEIYVCRPPTIANGKYSAVRHRLIQKKQYLRFESVRVWCDDDYVMEGRNHPTEITCDGFSWSRYVTCVKDRCDECSAHAACTNYKYFVSCKCNAGYEGNGRTCTKIPCYRHTCAATEDCVDAGRGNGYYSCQCKEGYKRVDSNCVEIPCYRHTCAATEDCVDSGRGNGDHSCQCKDGYKRVDSNCIVDHCANNDCHENAICTDTGSTYQCTCKNGFIGNGTYCQERLCNSTTYEGEISLNCTECEETCCNTTMRRECQVCIHTKCNGGEVCGEDSSRVPTVCTEKKCFENTGGFTVDAPSHVCLDSDGMMVDNLNCCWTGG